MNKNGISVKVGRNTYENLQKIKFDNEYPSITYTIKVLADKEMKRIKK